MSKKIRNVGFALLAIIVLASLAGLIWVNTIYIHQNPIEKNFLVPWLGMRTFLEFGNDPYGEPAAQRAQVLFYGNLADAGQDPLNLDQPFASEILFFPLALISDYTTARVVWMVLLELILIGSAFLCLYLFEWKLPIGLMVLYIVVAVFGVQAFLPITENSPTILISFFLMAGLVGLQKGLDELAGAAFGLAIFQPSATILFFLMIVSWVIRNRRWRVIWGGLMALGFLIVTSFALLPGWFLPFIRSFRTEFAFGGYQSTYGVLTSLWPAIGNKVAAALTVGLVIILILEWRATRQDNFRWFLWTSSLTLASFSLVGIPTLKVNSILLLIPFTFFISILSERMIGEKRWLLIGLMLGIVFIGFWAAILGLQKINDEVVTNLFTVFVPPLLLVAGLYWTRWWATRPPRTWMDMIERDIK